MVQKPRVIAVLPSYNAAKTLIHTYREIPRDVVESIILVDDASQDNTVEIAERLNLRVIRHKRNSGYGANQKTCYLSALEDGADIVVMVHPDYQYDPMLIPNMIEPIRSGLADCTLGSRMLLKGAALAGGMPMYKYIGNRMLTILENWVLGQKLSEYHTGYRAFSRKLLMAVPFKHNSNDFVFDTEIIIQLLAAGFKICEIPVPTRYFKEASSIDFFQSIWYGLGILKRLFLYIIWKLTGRQYFTILRTETNLIVSSQINYKE